MGLAGGWCLVRSLVPSRPATGLARCPTSGPTTRLQAGRRALLGVKGQGELLAGQAGGGIPRHPLERLSPSLGWFMARGRGVLLSNVPGFILCFILC